MKIQLKISSDAILAADVMLSSPNLNTPSGTITERVTLSLGLELGDIFHTRARQIIRESSLFNSNKIKKLTLKYHQAWALEQIIRNNKAPNNPYEASLLNAMADTINQKLI